MQSQVFFLETWQVLLAKILRFVLNTRAFYKTIFYISAIYQLLFFTISVADLIVLANIKLAQETFSVKIRRHFQQLYKVAKSETFAAVSE